MNDGEFFYLLWYVFPDKRPGDDELIIKVYRDVLSGKRKNFPRGYFLKNSQVEHRADRLLSLSVRKSAET